MYKITKDGGLVMTTPHQVSIPEDQSNRDYRDYLAWVAAGNIAEVEPQEDPTVVEDREITVKLNNRFNKVLSKILFDVDSRLRVLENRNPSTLADLRQKLKTLYMADNV